MKLSTEWSAAMLRVGAGHDADAKLTSASVYASEFTRLLWADIF